ncbi:hypothetical protein KC19_10G179000 [Ceratodon purpureus]|uniref:Uncharacterized protein n=1 Tax=Ceratodon purpureus TaxID=3225 RepID=A0A8T0GLI9_CERPU|nr:hypothetical protein KC19_10G179000 [Ceratodon purpureus]
MILFRLAGSLCLLKQMVNVLTLTFFDSLISSGASLRFRGKAYSKTCHSVTI